MRGPSCYTSVMNRQELVQLVLGLGLDADEYIVVGSGLLAMLELCEAGDLDLIVSPEDFQRFDEDSAWQRKTFKDGNYALVQGDCEIMLDWDSPDGTPNLQMLKSDEVVIDGIPFVSPTRLLAWKERHRRPKDLGDIQLLRDYHA